MKNMVKISMMKIAMTKNLIFLCLTLYISNGFTDVQADVDQSVLINYCSGKIDAGLNLINTRGEWTTREVIEELESSRKENNAPRYIFLDWVRMVRTISRYPEMTQTEFEQRFYSECMYLGF